jgi:hypothetical protein
MKHVVSIRAGRFVFAYGFAQRELALLDQRGSTIGKK